MKSKRKTKRRRRHTAVAAVASGGSGSERSRSRAARSSGALTPWRRLVRVRTAVGDDRKQLQPSLPPSRSATGTWVQGRRGHPRCGAATPCQVQPHPQKKKSSNLDGRLHAAVTASLPRSVVDFSGGGEKWWMGPSLTPPPSPRRSRSLSPDRSNSPGGRGSCSTIAIAARKRE